MMRRNLPGPAACTVLLALALGLAAVEEALAFGFSVEPARLELSVPAGKQRGKTVRVDNTKGRQPLHVKTYVQDVLFLPDGTSDFPPPGSTGWSCAQWIRVVPEELDVPPGNVQEVRVSVVAPAEARGGYYAMLFFETGPSYAERGVGVNFRIGVLTQVAIAGTEVAAAKLANLLVSPPKEVFVEVFNEGNILVRPKGKLKVFDGRGRRVGQVEFNAERLGVLPKTLRRFRTELHALPVGRYRLRAEIDYGTRYLLVGEQEFAVE